MEKQGSGLLVLLVDDDAMDRELFGEAMTAAGISCQLAECGNGEEALQYLKGADTLPALILLDLNMPVKDGRETLLELKADPRLQLIPVFILSTSSARFDVAEAYRNGANLFLTKPHDFAGLQDLAKAVLTLLGKFAVAVQPD